MCIYLHLAKYVPVVLPSSNKHFLPLLLLLLRSASHDLINLLLFLVLLSILLLEKHSQFHNVLYFGDCQVFPRIFHLLNFIYS